MNLQRNDYQKFDFSKDGEVIDIGERMSQKLSAIPLNDLKGKSVLDIGCDMGFWSFYTSCMGASKVTGLDRSRNVKGEHLDLIEYNKSAARFFDKHKNVDFFPVNIGRQWMDFGKHDVALLFSLYHHIYSQCWDHDPIWYWLYRHTSSELMWENPISDQDRVVQMNVKNTENFNQKAIFAASSKYFTHEYIGPANHEPYRFVFRFTPRKIERRKYVGKRISGAGGASKAWKYAQDRRTNEFEFATGIKVHPGSINVALEEEFDFNNCYYRFPMLDVADRSKGLESKWQPRWARVYPIDVNGRFGYVFRFEGEKYPLDFIEIVSPSWIEDEKIEVTTDA